MNKKSENEKVQDEKNINLIKKYYNNNSNSKNYYLKNKKLSNDEYLKQILGTKYKNEEDDFISRTEKKLIKEINEYILF